MFLERACFLLWLALLAFGLPEVLAGSSPAWATNPFVWVVTIPLYALHFLLLVQVALVTGRTSLPALYLLGVAFGLYETWITKVVWSGYPGSEGFAMGGLGPHFGLHETLGLVLCYHPVMSFLLPLAVLTRLFPRWGAEFPAPDWLFGASRPSRLARWSMVAIASVFTGLNLAGAPLYLATWLPFLAVVILGYPVVTWAARRAQRRGRDATAPRLSRTRTWVVAIATALLYLATYRGVLVERLPPASVQALTALAYPALTWLFFRTPKAGPPSPAPPLAAPHRIPLAMLLTTAALGFAISATGVTQTTPGFAVAAIAMAALIPIGVGLFVWIGLVLPLLRRA